MTGVLPDMCPALGREVEYVVAVDAIKIVPQVGVHYNSVGAYAAM